MKIRKTGKYTEVSVNVSCFNCGAEIEVNPSEIYYMNEVPHFRCPLCFWHIKIEEELPENFKYAKDLYSESQRRNARYIPVYIVQKEEK